MAIVNKDLQKIQALMMIQMKLGQNMTYKEIVPKAMKAIETALEDGDSETALEILKSVGVLRDRKAAKTKQEEQDDNELYNAIAQGREQRAIDEGTVNGEIVGRSGLAGLLEGASSEPEAASSANGPSGEPAITGNKQEAA